MQTKFLTQIIQLGIKILTMLAEEYKGHLTALFTVFLWGTTFISTKVLLNDFLPVEILFIRFCMGWFLLFLLSFHGATQAKEGRAMSFKQELIFAGAGFTGTYLYFLLENIALTYTMASNVGVLVCVSPFLTALLVYFFMKSEEKLQRNFFIGFIVAISGIFLISFNGSKLQLNPLGDILALSAALVWACYSLLTKEISKFGLPVITATRKTFFYGILFMLPTLFIFDAHFEIAKFKNITNLFNLVYLGVGASALCFVTWNYTVKVLGAIKTSVYIYLIPVITVITAVIILDEPISWLLAFGTLLTITGLFISNFSREKMQFLLKTRRQKKAHRNHVQ